MKKTLYAILMTAIIASATACGNTNAEAEPASNQVTPVLSAKTEYTPAAGNTEMKPDDNRTHEPSVNEDPYGLGVNIDDINWDAVVYDYSGDLLDDGYPSMYQNLAQTVNLMYSTWTEYGYHEYIDGQSLTFLDVITNAEASNMEVWDCFGQVFYADVYAMIADKAESAFRVDNDTKKLLILMDDLSMDQLAEIMSSPAFQTVNEDDIRTAHNPELTAYFENIETVNQTYEPEPEPEYSEAEMMAAIFGISEKEYLELEAETQAILNNPAYAENAWASDYASMFNMTVDQYNAVIPVIRQIATDALATGTTDLDHVRAASRMLHQYVDSGTYGFEPGYDSPYGLIVNGNFSCAGTAATMILTLNEMGYTLEYNDIGWNGKGQWTHQWASLIMDGQYGWADCMGGIADYGDYPFSCKTPDATYTDPETGEIFWIDWSQQ